MSKPVPATRLQTRSSIDNCAQRHTRELDTLPAINGPAWLSFAKLKYTTKLLYGSESGGHNPRFDRSTGYKFSKFTPLALHNTLEAETLELVFADKAFDRAAIVTEKKLWNEERQVMVWTEFSEDSPEEGMTIDNFECQATLQRSRLKRWSLISVSCHEQELSQLSRQASAEFLSYLNKNFAW